MKLKILTRLLAIGSSSALGVAIMYSTPAMAVDYGLLLRYDYIYSDNINLVPVNTQGEFINQYTVGFSLDHKSPKLEAAVTSNIQYRDYKRNITPNDTYVTIDAYSLFKISPQHFTWLVQDNVQQTNVSRNAAAAPSNTQRTNVFITGPDYTIRINPVNNVVLSVRYFDIQYETSNLSNKSNQAGVSWVYRLNSTNSISLNFIKQYVDYENELINNNQDRTDSFVRYENRRGRNVLTFLAGKTNIKPKNLPEIDGDLQQFNLVRTINTNSNLSILLSKRLTDSRMDLTQFGGAFGVGIGSGGILNSGNSGGGGFLNSGIYLSRFAELAYNLKKGGFTYGLSIYRDKVDFVNTLNDEIRNGGNIAVGYSFTPTLTGALSVTYTKTNFQDFDRKDTDTTKTFLLAWLLSRRLVVDFNVTRNERESIGLSRDVDYIENRYSVGVSYTFGKSALAARSGAIGTGTSY